MARKKREKPKPRERALRPVDIDPDETLERDTSPPDTLDIKVFLDALGLDQSNALAAFVGLRVANAWRLDEGDQPWLQNMRTLTRRAMRGSDPHGRCAAWLAEDASNPANGRRREAFMAALGLLLLRPSLRLEQRAGLNEIANAPEFEDLRGAARNIADGAITDQFEGLRILERAMCCPPPMRATPETSHSPEPEPSDCGTTTTEGDGENPDLLSPSPPAIDEPPVLLRVGAEDGKWLVNGEHVAYSFGKGQEHVSADRAFVLALFNLADGKRATLTASGCRDANAILGRKHLNLNVKIVRAEHGVIHATSRLGSREVVIERWPASP